VVGKDFGQFRRLRSLKGRQNFQQSFSRKLRLRLRPSSSLRSIFVVVVVAVQRPALFLQARDSFLQKVDLGAIAVGVDLDTVLHRCHPSSVFCGFELSSIVAGLDLKFAVTRFYLNTILLLRRLGSLLPKFDPSSILSLGAVVEIHLVEKLLRRQDSNLHQLRVVDLLNGLDLGLVRIGPPLVVHSLVPFWRQIIFALDTSIPGNGLPLVPPTSDRFLGRRKVRQQNVVPDRRRNDGVILPVDQVSRNERPEVRLVGASTSGVGQVL